MYKLLILIISLFICSTSFAASATLKWIPPTQNEDILGYRILYSQTSQHYQNSIDVGLNTTGTVPNLIEGTWYFSVVCYSNYADSPRSNEVFTTITKNNLNSPGNLRILISSK